MKNRLTAGRIFILLSAFLLSAGIAAAETPVGRIAYLEGIVDVHRDGEIIELFDSDVGMELLNQDLIETGGDGVLTVEITAFRNSGTTITVSENTAFYFDVTRSMGGDVKTEMPMLAGSLAFKVQKLSGSEELNVRTSTAVMGVRGTEFEVVSAPEGSVLVVCVEGRVACQDDQRGQQTAQAGRVVEKRSGENIRRIDVDPGDERLYRDFWEGQREQVFKAGAATFIKAYSQQYQTLLPQFSEAYQKVLSHRDTLLRYGRTLPAAGVNADLMMIYNELSRDLIPSRGIFVMFEQVFYSVKVLQRYHSQGIGQTRINPSLTSQEFFNNFNSYQSVLTDQLANMHYFYKLFANIAGSASPAGEILGDVFSSGNNPLGGGNVPTGNVPSGGF